MKIIALLCSLQVLLVACHLNTTIYPYKYPDLIFSPIKKSTVRKHLPLEDKDGTLYNGSVNQAFSDSENSIIILELATKDGCYNLELDSNWNVLFVGETKFAY